MYLTKAGMVDRPGPEAPVSLCSPESAGALCGMYTNHGLTADHPPDHDRLLGAQEQHAHTSSALSALARTLRQVLQVVMLGVGAWLAWRAGIPERIGYARDGRSLLLTKAVKVPRAEETPAHEMFYYLELLRRIGWLDDLPVDERVVLDVPEPRRQRGMELLLEAGARPHAGSDAPTRCRRGRPR